MKRWLVGALALAVMLISVPAAGVPAEGAEPYPHQRFCPGDVNWDGNVDSTDARQVLQFEVRLIDLETIRQIAADVNGDEHVDSTDARMILQYEVKLLDGFPDAAWPDAPGEPVAPVEILPPVAVFEAADYTDAVIAGTAGANELAADFTSFGGSFKAGDRLVYAGVDFGDGGFNTLMMLVSSKSQGAGGRIVVYADEMSLRTGLAFVELPAMDDENVFVECYAPLEKNLLGAHDVIFVFEEDITVNIDCFAFSPYDGTETAAQKDERMQWFRDAHFGQFIHFGPYSLPGGVYGGRNVGGDGAEWIMQRLGISREDYARNIAKPFNPTDFSAKKIVSLAKAAGQKYIVITSKHHDGFSMYDTNVRTFRDYKLTGYGDYKGGDPLAELAQECRRQGILFCVYYSIPDWYDESQTDFGDTMRSGYKDEYKTRMKGQLRELIGNYDPALIWFDQGGDRKWWNAADGAELYRYIRTLSPAVISNNRLFVESNRSLGDYGTPEQNIPGGTQTFDWESCMTMNDSWGYKSYSTNWKSAEELVANLVDVTSKGGSYLLNIGPDGLGNVPEVSQQILREVGGWLDVYGEAVYGARQSCFVGVREGHKVTVKDGKIYVFFKGATLPETVTVPAPDNDILGVRDMGGGALTYTLTASELRISTAGMTRHPYYNVIEIAVEGYPAAKTHENYAARASGVAQTDYYQGNAQYIGAKAVDGDANTRWATNDGVKAAMLTLTFDTPVTVDTAFIQQHTSPTNWTHAFRIEYWDGGAWQTACEGGDPGEECWCDFDAVTTTRIRLNVTDANHPTFWEFQLYLLRA